MSTILRAIWTVPPTVAPQPQLHCRRCGAVSNFVSSGKIRVNSNGKKLDAWLIYKCATCESTWNRPLLERRPVSLLEPAYLRALQGNDQELADNIALDIADLKRWAPCVAVFGGTQVKKQVEEGGSGGEAFEIRLVVRNPVAMRLDRFLAEEFGIGRARIQALYDAGKLVIDPGGPRVLRRPLRNGTRISGSNIHPGRIAGRPDSG